LIFVLFVPFCGQIKLDGFVKSPNLLLFVILAKAGIQ
jgi:hypothetical protein